MRIGNTLIIAGLLGGLVVSGCGKQSPMAPAKTGSNQGGTVTAQTWKPAATVFSATLSGDAGYKPWNWFDADDTPGFNATIRTRDNGQSANVTRVNGGTWGKVHTKAITCSSLYHTIRILVPSHSASVAWKLIIQEEGGAWRNWVLQESTGETGYKDYDFAAILAEVNSGGGKFTINIVVEGEVGQWIEVSELHVFNPDDGWYYPNYWEEEFTWGATGAGDAHTPGWFDNTTNPDFGATIKNTSGGYGQIDVVNPGGKVLTPVITWDPEDCRFFQIGVDEAELELTVIVQKQEGDYMQASVPGTRYLTYYYHDHFGPPYYWSFDLRDISFLTKGQKFSIAISNVRRSHTVDWAKIY